MTKAETVFKDMLRELVEAILEGEAGREIDAGCDGDGPVANAIVLLDMAPDVEAATEMIFGPDELDEEE